MLIQVNPSTRQVPETKAENLSSEQTESLTTTNHTRTDFELPEVLGTEARYFQSFYFELAEKFISLLGFVLLIPLLALISVLVKLNSKGPVIYSQVRLGKNGKQFKILKFRSMVIDAEATGPKICTCYSDPRITNLGSTLRKYKLDELPQLINVIKGEMSLVGPRPERPVFHEKNQWIPNWNKRLDVKPGITGLAQISKHISHKPEQKIYADLFYCTNRTLKSDISLIFMTIFPFLRKDKFFGIQLK